MKSIYDWIVKYDAAHLCRRSAYIWFNIITVAVFILLTILPLDLPLYIKIGRRIRLDYLLHVMAFTVYMASQMVLLPVRWRNIPMISLITMFTVGMAIGLEWIQKFIAFRRFSRRDILFSVTGVLIGLAVGLLLNLFIAMVKKRAGSAASHKTRPGEKNSINRYVLNNPDIP